MGCQSHYCTSKLNSVRSADVYACIAALLRQVSLIDPTVEAVAQQHRDRSIPLDGGGDEPGQAVVRQR